MNTLARAISATLLLSACGDDASGTNDSGTSPPRDGGGTPGEDSGGGGDTDSGIDPGVETFTVDWGPYTAAAGEEDTRCVTKRITNATQIRVHQLHNVLGGYSHHLIVYRVADETESLEPTRCQPFTDTLDPARGSTLTVTQRADETISLPDGVAFTLQPGQMIRLELHYINYGREPAEISASSTFITMPEADYEHEADFLFIGNPDIEVPPHAAQTLGPTFFRVPPEFSGVNFFAITGHTHQFGTNVTVGTASGSGALDTMVYDVDGWDWDEPDTVYHDPPFQIPSGGGFQFTCEYMNTSDEAVGFGESANEEMCFFWAYYYPSQGSRVCAHTDQLPVPIDICCPGNDFCDRLF
jgi:hypothetical protein